MDSVCYEDEDEDIIDFLRFVKKLRKHMFSSKFSFIWTSDTVKLTVFAAISLLIILKHKFAVPKGDIVRNSKAFEPPHPLYALST